MRRRTFILAGGCALMSSPAAARLDRGGLARGIRALEAEVGGRIGLAILGSGGGTRFAWRGDERFPMCSTFKFLLAAAILARVDAGRDRLDRMVPVTKGDIIANSPFAETRVGAAAGVGELCAAAIGRSDNAAANLLLPSIGGPAGLTRFARALGDPLTRLDRSEPLLNEAAPGDPRDTTTPAAMLGLMATLLLGRALAPASRGQLLDWMLASRTGDRRLRAGLPAGWTVADKTGAGDHGTDNEIALIRPPGRAPLLVASYLTGSERPLDQTNAVHARIGGLMARAIGQIAGV